MSIALEQSSSLMDLAARVKTEHEAVGSALKEGVQHAVAAGELLLEAKKQLKHGQWLSWLREHCTISERTAQLYMRCAKSRDEIEEQIRNGVADLSLSEAAAILALSSDMKKLLEFVRRAEGMDTGDLIEHCAENGIAVITKSPFGAPEFSELDDPEKLEWLLYQVWSVRRGGSCEATAYYSDRLQTRGWRVTMNCKDNEQWFGDWGDRYRKSYGKVIPQFVKDDWFAFYESNRARALTDVEAEIKQLFEQEQARPRLRKRRAA
jgi:hypothetical protein